MKKSIQKRILRVAKVLNKLSKIKTAGSYTIKITPEGFDTLRFLAHRYESANVLYDGIEARPDSEETNIYDIPEHVLWEAMDATSEDGGAYGRIPNLGGDLGKQIHDLFDNIV